jgi:hypothetical protein
MHIQRLACGLLFPALLLAACGGGSGDAPGPEPESRRTPSEKLALRTFRADCSDFLDYAADALTEQFLAGFRCLGIGPCPVFVARPEPQATPTPTPAATPAPGAAASPGAEDFSGPDRVSGTNVQEQGVDEADIVKADAQGRLYILSGRRLLVLAAFPPAGLEQRPLASLDLTDGDSNFYAADFFLDEAAQRIVALGSGFGETGAQSIAVIVDIADPAAPQVLGQVRVDGSLLQARRIGARIHRVSRYEVPVPGWFYGDDPELSALRDDYFRAVERGDEAGAARIRTAVRARIGLRVAETGAQALLPRSRVDAAESTLACDAIAHPEVTTGLGLALIDSFDVDGSGHAVSGIVNNAYVIYASTANLYLVQSSFGWFFDPRQTEETVIYRLALPASGAPVYRGLAKLDGTVNNSYQLSEFDGTLRVAATALRTTTDGRFEPVSAVSVFDAQASGEMPLRGALRDLAPGETVQGVRFIGERGFVVTFRNVDPLFAIDLSNPAQPRVASELKIPGFSSYLMPLGDDYLLTIGRAGTDEQLTGGVAVQLFDVADLAGVRQLAVLEPQAGPRQYSYSVAEYDPRAFSYFADDPQQPVPGTLSIPLQTYGETDAERFTGFLVVRVDPVAAPPLAELGRIDHRALIASEEFCDGGDASASPCSNAVHAAEPRRSVFMQDASGRYLYTVSLAGLVASDAAQPSTTYGSRALPYDPPCCYFEAPPPGRP